MSQPALAKRKRAKARRTPAAICDRRLSCLVMFLSDKMLWRLGPRAMESYQLDRRYWDRAAFIFLMVSGSFVSRSFGPIRAREP